MNFEPDVCLSLFEKSWEAAKFVFPQGARVLEIGCAEANWLTPMHEARPDLDLVGIDWRQCDRPGAKFIRGDVLKQKFELRSFDAIVLVSALEHIGLGHYENDPKADFGDIYAMALIDHWLKPGGFVYFDVPYQPDRYDVVGTKCRVYNDTALEIRLGRSDLHERWRGYFTEDTLLPERPTERAKRWHYVACVLEKA